MGLTPAQARETLVRMRLKYGHLGLGLLLTLGTTRIVPAQTHTAFSATLVETVYKLRPPTEVFYKGQAIAAHRADGSTVYAREVADPRGGPRALHRWVTDVAAQETFIVNGLTGSVSTSLLPWLAVLHLRAAPRCEGAVVGEVAGFPVVKSVNVIPQETGIMREEQLLAPELNCLVMRNTLLLGPSEQERRIARVDEVTVVRLGTPPPELFEKPKPYREWSPSEHTSAFYRRYPAAQCPTCAGGDGRQ